MRNTGSRFLPVLLALAAMAGGILAYASPASSSAAPKSKSLSVYKSPVASTGPVEYGCRGADGRTSTLKATFYQTSPGMVFLEYGGQARPAFQGLSADGSRYEGKDLLFWEARGEATVSWSGIELTCKPH